MLPRPCACENRGAKRRAKTIISTFFFISVFPFRGLSEAFVSAMPTRRGVPGASITQLLPSHHERNMTQHSLAPLHCQIVAITYLNGSSEGTLRAVSRRCQS